MWIYILYTMYSVCVHLQISTLSLGIKFVFRTVQFDNPWKANQYLPRARCRNDYILTSLNFGICSDSNIKKEQSYNHRNAFTQHAYNFRNKKLWRSVNKEYKSFYQLFFSDSNTNHYNYICTPILFLNAIKHNAKRTS